MRIVFPLTLASALGCSALLGGCAGGSPAPASLVPSAAIRHVSSRSLKPDGGEVQPYLFVSDPDNTEYQNDGDIQFFHNDNYRSSGIITAGLDGPLDLFVDDQSNLYAANVANVTEYAPDSYGDALFTYSAGLYYPTSVAVDRQQNLFVSQAWAGHGFPGGVSEYSQQVNSVVAECLPSPSGGSAFGIAVDSTGDVFLSWSYGSTSQILEYRGGLGSCNSRKIKVGFLPLGLAIDKHNDLLVAAADEVIILDPPYTSISQVLASGFNTAATVHLNRQNTLAYVTDIRDCDVQVLNYPSGTLVKMLGTQDGLFCPYGAVDSPNAVY